MASPILAFKAGRAFRRTGTNFVEPSPTKGAILLTNEDGLLHFIWKNRETGEQEEDLILFPSDASFEKVSESPSSRAYVLKFSSSNQRHFFWMQDAESSRDAEFVANVNGLLEDPEYNLVLSTSTTSAPQPSSSSTAPASSQAIGGSTQPSPEELARMRALISSMGSSGEPTTAALSLTDILTPAVLNPLFTRHPQLIPALFPHLPPDLPTPPSAEVLQRTINSPQFRSSVQNFDQALRTGLLTGLVRSMGLPEQAGLGVEPFLRAIQEQAARESSERMETD